MKEANMNEANMSEADMNEADMNEADMTYYKNINTLSIRTGSYYQYIIMIINDIPLVQCMNLIFTILIIYVGQAKEKYRRECQLTYRLQTSRLSNSPRLIWDIAPLWTP